MTHKLTPIMTEAITSAYRRVVEGYRPAVHGGHYVIHGLKTNTANALTNRGLIRAARVGAFTEYVLTDAGIALADTLTRDAAWRVQIEEQANATAITEMAAKMATDVLAQRAEIARREHFANATSEDIARADGDGPIYRASHAALLSAIAAAYPDVQAADVYDVWADCNESIAYCAWWVRKNGPLSAQYSATEDTEDTETDWVDALQADPSASTRNPHWACDTPGATGCPTGEHADRAPLETVVGTVDIPATVGGMSPAMKLALWQSGLTTDGTLARGEDGYGTQWVRGGTGTHVALMERGLVDHRPNPSVEGAQPALRLAVTPIGFAVLAWMIAQGVTQGTIMAEEAPSSAEQAWRDYGAVIISRRGVIKHIGDDMVNPDADTPIGTVIVAPSRGEYRRGVLINNGRSNVTFAYTTEGAVQKNATRPHITVKSVRREQAWMVDPRASMIHADGGDENMINPADLVPGDVADADTDAIDRAECDAVAAMIEAERAEEDAYATEHAEMENATVAALADAYHDAALKRDHHGRHAPHMAVKPRGISPLSARERDARKARRRAQKKARKIARRAGR